MKKLVLLAGLFVSLTSFTTYSSMNEEITTEIETLDVEIYRCRADISYNERYVTSVYGYGSSPEAACANAREAANAFIAAQ